MSIYTIYRATNSVNGKMYIGFDSNWPSRISDHKKDYNLSSKSTIIFYRAIKKYGWDNFKWDILYQSKDSDHTLNCMEEYFIKEYNTYVNLKNNNGYNMTLGGDGTLGLKWSDDSKQKLKKPHSAERRRKNSEAQTGKKLSASTIDKIKKANTGKSRSTEFKKNQSNLAKKNNWRPKLDQTPELRQARLKKISNSITKAWERKKNDGTSTGNFYWITNNSINLRIRSTESIPQGWKRGRTIKRDPNTGVFTKQDTLS